MIVAPDGLAKVTAEIAQMPTAEASLLRIGDVVRDLLGCCAVVVDGGPVR
jgi:hypothetical protein